jgi:anti-anti-sigma factor
VFDLTDLGFMNCAVARAIVDAAQALPDGQRPVLRSPNGTMLRLLAVTGLDKQVAIEE